MNALIIALATLSADAPPAVVIAPPAVEVQVEVATKPRLQRVIVGYRRACGPGGCTMIPIYRMRAVAQPAEVTVEARPQTPITSPSVSTGCANGACSPRLWRPFRWFRR